MRHVSSLVSVIAEEHEDNAHLAESKASILALEHAALDYLCATYGYRLRAEELGRSRSEWLIRAAKCARKAGAACVRVAELIEGEAQ